MKKTRIAIAGAALSAALGLATPAVAHAQTVVAGVRPRGVVSVGFAGPRFTIGAYVPFGFVGAITFVPGYGYGFYCDEGFVPVQAYGSQWVIAGGPIVLSSPSFYRYSYVGPRGYRSYGGYGSYGRYENRRVEGQRDGRSNDRSHDSRRRQEGRSRDSRSGNR